jgi:hypothetical protein
MGDRLVGFCRVTIDGFPYENGPDPSAPGQPISCVIEHTDQDASRLELTVWDAATDKPYPEFNRFPSPRIAQNIRVICHAGWEDEEIVKMFEGVLVIATMDMVIPSTTTFIAYHNSYKLRKKAKSDTFHRMSVTKMLIRKAAEHGCTIKFDKTWDEEPAVHETMDTYYQVAEPNWDLMFRYIAGLGYAVICKGANELYVTRGKQSGTIIRVNYGDENLKSLAVRDENKLPFDSPNLRGHHHEGTAGKHAVYPAQVLVPNDDHRGVWEEPIQMAMDVRGQEPHHKRTLARASVKGRSKLMRDLGQSVEIRERFRPSMINQEVYVVGGFGPRINGAYHTTRVTHKMMNEWTTEAAAWKPY